MDTSVTDTDSSTLQERLPVAGMKFILCLMVALSIGTAISAIQSWNRWEAYQGCLQARSRNVFPGRAGRITRYLIKQGDIVEVGTPLLELKDAALESRRQELAQQVHLLKAQHEERVAQAEVELQKRKQQLDAEIFQVQLRLAELKRHPASGPAVEAPATPPPISPLAFTSAPNQRGGAYSLGTWETGLRQLKLCEERLSQLEQEREQLPQEIRVACGVQVAQTRLNQVQTELAQVEQEQKTLVVKAETHGTVGLLQAKVGDFVTAEQAIVELLDEDQPYLIVRIPTHRLSDFNMGTPLKIQFPGELELDGRVEAIPPQVVRESRQKGAGEERGVAVIVVPKGAVWPQMPFGAEFEVRRYH